MISAISNVNFQAKMNLDNVKSNKKYWEKFAKSFESNTKNDGGELRLSDDVAHDFSENLLFKFKTDKSGLDQGKGVIACNKFAMKEFSKTTPAKAAKKVAWAFKLVIDAANEVAQLRNKLYEKAELPECKKRAEQNWEGFRAVHFLRPKQKKENWLNHIFKDGELKGLNVGL